MNNEGTQNENFENEGCTFHWFYVIMPLVEYFSNSFSVHIIQPITCM